MPVSNGELKERLLKERTRLLATLNRLDETNYSGTGYGNHIADDATETFEQSKVVSMQKNGSFLLKQIEHALEKFDLGTFGICESCGVPIDRARLKALPYASYCMDCKEHGR